MKFVVAIDTTGAQGSIALLKDGETLEIVPLAGGTYSAQLMPQIAALLQRHGADKRGIDAYVAASGPGSFTGLRVGLSTVKALAEISGKPIAAVSLLEAIAWAEADPERHSDSPVMAVLDAMRGEVYVGEYTVPRDQAPKLLREVLLPLPELAAEAQLAPELPILTPDESVSRALGERGQRAKLVGRPQADTIGRLGALKVSAGHVTSPEALDANYIRRSDAEIFSKPKA